MSAAVEPTSVRIDDTQKTFAITWEDGHQSRYPWWYLRGLCPCAACQGHGGATRFVPTEAAQLGDVDEVGHYALRLVWGDAHQTGIYSFAYLRTLCPCQPCQTDQAQAHAVHLLPPERAAELAQ